MELGSRCVKGRRSIEHFDAFTWEWSMPRLVSWVQTFLVVVRSQLFSRDGTFVIVVVGGPV